MWMKKHRCTLNLGSHSMLPMKASPGRWFLVCRRIRKLTLASTRHPLTCQHFTSYPAVVAERQKQVLTAGKCLMHPICLLNLYWSTLMVAVNTAHIVTSSFRLCFVLEPGLHSTDIVLLSLNAIVICDITARLNTGYFVSEGRRVVLERRLIACHYFPWMILDAVSCAPVNFALALRNTSPNRWMLLAHLLPLLRVTRLARISKDVWSFLSIFFRSNLNCRFLRLCFLSILIMHLFCCSVYLAPVWVSYWTGKPALGVNIFVGRNSNNTLATYSLGDRYRRALFISTSTIMGTGFSLLIMWDSIEIVFNSIIIIMSTVFMTYTLVFLLKVEMTKYNSTIKYYELMDQVEKYMRHKQFPAPLKQRVIQLYHYRYQQHYFKEDEALACLSERLRHEVRYHTCRKFLEKVQLFEGVPASLMGSVLSCLKSEVFMRSDLVVRAGDVTECMYFVARGTVALLSVKGTELCHLEDGANFGEVELMMRSKMVVTVVAIETTQLYRLDAEDFRRYLLTNKIIHDRLIEMSARHMQEHTLLAADIP